MKLPNQSISISISIFDEIQDHTSNCQPPPPHIAHISISSQPQYSQSAGLRALVSTVYHFPDHVDTRSRGLRCPAEHDTTSPASRRFSNLSRRVLCNSHPFLARGVIFEFGVFYSQFFEAELRQFRHRGGNTPMSWSEGACTMWLLVWKRLQNGNGKRKLDHGGLVVSRGSDLNDGWDSTNQLNEEL